MLLPHSPSYVFTTSFPFLEGWELPERVFALFPVKKLSTQVVVLGFIISASLQPTRHNTKSFFGVHLQIVLLQGSIVSISIQKKSSHGMILQVGTTAPGRHWGGIWAV